MTEEIITRAGVIAGVDGNDDLLAVCAELAINYVIALCRVDTLTEAMYAVTAEIAAAAYRKADNGDIVSLKEGDRQINYSTVVSAAQEYTGLLRPFVNCTGKVPSEV